MGWSIAFCRLSETLAGTISGVAFFLSGLVDHLAGNFLTLSCHSCHDSDLGICY